MAKKRVLLSIQVYNTQRLLLSFLILGAIILGTAYIFLSNRVAMRGYVLQQETEKNYNLLLEKERIYSKISQYQTQDFISEAPLAQTMLASDTSNQHFAVIKEKVLTAQK